MKMIAKAAEFYMEKNLKDFINGLFASVPNSERAFSIKSEALGKMMIIYDNCIADGKSENEAYALAVSSLGDTGVLLARARNEEVKTSDGSGKKEKKRAATITAVAVVLYILCPIPLFVFQNEKGLALMFPFIAIATGLIVFNAITNKKGREKQQNPTLRAVSTALWSIILVLYFILSFATNAWFITWVLFLIGAAVEGIIKAAIELKETEE